MQKRHLNRRNYFDEQVNTSRKYYLGYIEKYIPLGTNTRVLEVGCGEGGNLIPFAERGCVVSGVDRSADRTAQAREFFAHSGYTATFITLDFFNMQPVEEKEKYEVILIHDVIEHIAQKELFMKHLHHFLTPSGVVFWAFPAWQMPFGGHQQICRNKLCSFMPFIHLLPAFFYHNLLKVAGEKEDCINELLEIRECATTIELFERLLANNQYRIVNRQLWLINPHYERKFGLRPRKLPFLLNHIRYVRNFFTTSCFYLTSCSDKKTMSFS